MQAIADFTKAIELNPNNPTAYRNRGRVYICLGNIQQGEADFEKAEKLRM